MTQIVLSVCACVVTVCCVV